VPWGRFESRIAVCGWLIEVVPLLELDCVLLELLGIIASLLLEGIVAMLELLCSVLLEDGVVLVTMSCKPISYRMLLRFFLH